MDMQIEPKIGQKVKCVRTGKGIRGWSDFLDPIINPDVELVIASKFFGKECDGWWIGVEGHRFIRPMVMFDTVDEQPKEEKKEEEVVPIVPKKKDKSPFKFQVGDRVKVIVERCDQQWGGHGDNMDVQVGKIFTISRLENPLLADGHTGYRLEGDEYNYGWDERLLKRVRKAKKPIEPIAAAPIPVKPRAINDAIVGDWVIGKADQGLRLAGNRFQIKEIIPDEMRRIGNDLLRIDLNAGGLEGFYRKRFILDPGFVQKEQPKEPVKPVPKGEENSHIPLILKELTKKVNGDAGTCSYAKHRVGSPDKDFIFHVRDACHARLNHYQPGVHRYDQVALNVDGHLESINEKEQGSYKSFVEYITTQSPWKDCFLHRSIGQTFKWGICMNVQRPMAELMGAAVALRGGSEFKSELPIFQMLIDEGFSGHSAYLLSHCLRPAGKDQYNFTGITNGHRVFWANSDFNGIVKFFQSGYYLTREKKPTIEEGHSTEIGKHIAERTIKLNIQLENKLKELLQYKGEVHVWGQPVKPIEKDAVLNAACELDKILFC